VVLGRPRQHRLPRWLPGRRPGQRDGRRRAVRLHGRRRDRGTDVSRRPVPDHRRTQWHLLNPDASLWGAIAIAVEAGGILAAAYAATRNLWIPIGVHFGWNFAEAGIFGTEVSGNGKNDGLLHGVTSGSTLLTGGKFGSEASPYTIVFGLLLTVLFMWLAHRRGSRWVAASRSPRHHRAR
jgi:hypothetical protein